MHRARGNAWPVSFQPQKIPRTQLLPSTSTGYPRACAHVCHLPSTPQWPVLYTAATVILLTFKSHHITCLYKTTKGSHLTWSRSQGHHSGTRPHKINLRTCHSLSLLFPISLPLTTLPPVVPQTCQPHFCLRTFARALSFTGRSFSQISLWLPLAFPSGLYSNVTFSVRSSLLFLIYLYLWHLSPSSRPYCIFTSLFSMLLVSPRRM